MDDLRRREGDAQHSATAPADEAVEEEAGGVGQEPSLLCRARFG